MVDRGDQRAGVRVGQVRDRAGTHPAGVRAAVTVGQALVIASRGQDQRDPAVGHGDDVGLPAEQPLEDDPRGARHLVEVGQRRRGGRAGPTPRRRGRRTPRRPAGGQPVAFTTRPWPPAAGGEGPGGLELPCGEGTAAGHPDTGGRGDLVAEGLVSSGAGRPPGSARRPRCQPRSARRRRRRRGAPPARSRRVRDRLGPPRRRRRDPARRRRAGSGRALPSRSRRCPARRPPDRPRAAGQLPGERMPRPPPPTTRIRGHGRRVIRARGRAVDRAPPGGGASAGRPLDRLGPLRPDRHEHDRHAGDSSRAVTAAGVLGSSASVRASWIGSTQPGKRS